MERTFVIGCVIFCLVIGVGLSAPVAANSSDTKSAEIDTVLAESTGEQTLIVRLSERPDESIRATAQGSQVSAMKSHAAETQSAFENFAEENPHVEIEREFWITNALAVTVDTDNVPLDRLGMVDNVEQIHENSQVEIQRTPAVPDRDTKRNTVDSVGDNIGTTYGLEKIGTTETWDGFDNRGDGVRVAVLDTGIDTTHPDLELTADGWAEFDTYGGRIDSEPYDSETHGTHVSGTVAGGNESGTAIGVAPDVELMHGLVLPGGSGYFTQITAGMQWAVENDADVISMSLGGSNRSDEYIDHVRNAQAQGAVVVTSSGNDGEGTSSSPGDVYDSFSVGATDDSDLVADFSSGENVSRNEWSDPPSEWPAMYTVPDVVAPGSGIYSSTPDGGYGYSSGTSMAAPHVSGGIALMLSNGNDELTPAEIQQQFVSTAVDIGEAETRQGAGRINIYNATLKHSRETLSPTIMPIEANVSVPTDVFVEANHPIQQYYWAFGNGTTVTTNDATIERTFQAKGSETVTLTIEDTAGKNITSSAQIQIVDEIRPVPQLTANRTATAEVGVDPIEFNASQSTDNDEIRQYEWNFGDGETTTTESPAVTHTYEAIGPQSPAVTVVDKSGNTNTTSLEIDIVDTTPPNPEITAPDSATIQTPVEFSAANSTDNNRIASYNWEFDDGTVRTGRKITHEFTEARTESVTLSVIDKSGNTESTSIEIAIQAAPSISVTRPVEGSYISSATVPIEYRLSKTNTDELSGVEYRVLSDSANEPVTDWTNGEFTATDSPISQSVTTESLVDGNYTAEFRLVNGTGDPVDLESATDSVSFALKTTEPVIELAIDPTTSGFDQYGPNNPAVLNVTVDDPLRVDTRLLIRHSSGSTVTEWDLSARTGSGNHTTVSWNGTDAAMELAESGAYEVAVIADDGIGNKNETIENISIDTDIPSVSVQSIEGGRSHDGLIYINDSTTAAITVTVDDGQETADQIQDVTLRALSSTANYRVTPPLETADETNWTATLSGSVIDDPGRYTLVAIATDAANNTGESNRDAIEYDPTVPRLSTAVTEVDPTAGTADVQVRSTETLEETPTVAVTVPNGSDEVISLTEDGDRWRGQFVVGDSGQYELWAEGTDRAGNRGADTATATIDSGVSTTNRSTTVYSDSTGLFIRFNTSQEVDNRTVSMTETTISPEPLAPEQVGVQFLEGELDDVLNAHLTNATIGVPADPESLPEGITADDEQVYIGYYNSSGVWERQPTRLERVEGFDGKYWTATVDSFSSYGVTVTDSEPPSLTDVSASVADDNESVTISAAYADELSGVNQSTLSLDIDGTDQTAHQSTSITSREATRTGYPVGNGSYTVGISLEDTAGNRGQYERDVSVSFDDETDERRRTGGGGGGGSGGGGGGGGGGGNSGAYVPTPSEPEGVNIINYETADLEVDSDVGRSVVSFSGILSSSTVQQVRFDHEWFETVIRTVDYDRVPPSVTEPGGRLVQLSQIIVPEQLTGTAGTITATVDRRAISSNDAVDDLVVLRYTDDEWVPLETTVSEETTETVTVDAETAGFSYFAIVEDDGTLATEASTDAVDDRSNTDETTDQSPLGLETVVIAVIVAAALFARRRP